MAQILEKLAVLQNASSVPPSSGHQEDQVSSKVESLERQLSGLTQRRLEYLEEMQRHQLGWQVNWVRIL